ncbi:MAG: hypothetical protein ACMUJM_14470 [bacterium]
MITTPSIQTRQTSLDLSRPSKNRESNAPQIGIGKKIHVPQEEPTEWASGMLERGSKRHIAFNNLQSLTTGLNAVAMNVRVADKKMQDLEEQVKQMKNKLVQRKKMYPPFLNNGIEQKGNILKEYQAIQKQIDQLTIPPNEKILEMVSNPEYTESEEFELPIVPEHITDKKIYATIKDLDMGLKKLQEKRGSLSEDALKMLNQYRNNTDEEFGSADIGEPEAEYKSIEIKDGLMMEPGMSLTEAQSRLLSLLE